MAEIMDVSRWQGRIDWDAVKRSGKIDGVMLRVLGSKGGKPYVDPAFERNYAACTARGIPVGGYYYTCAVTQRQTEEELAALKTALRGKTFQLPLAIDVEDPRLRSMAPAKLSALVARAADRIETWNLYAMVYTYTNFADTALAAQPLARVRHALHRPELRAEQPLHGRRGPQALRRMAGGLPHQEALPRLALRDVAVHQQRKDPRHCQGRRPQRGLQGLRGHHPAGRADESERNISDAQEAFYQPAYEWPIGRAGAAGACRSDREGKGRVW